MSTRSKRFLSLRTHWYIGITLALLPFASGCAIVPIPIPSETHLEYMDREAADFIEVGKSSRDDVLYNLGSPTVLSVDPSIWIYSVREYLSTRWQLCYAIIAPSDIAAGCSNNFARPLATEGKEKYLFLEIGFDSSRIVTHRQISSLAIRECTEAGFCWNGLPAFRPTRGGNGVPAKYCAVHLYTPNTAIFAKLKIDGSDEFDLSLTNNDFQLVLLQLWQHQIVISFDDGSKQRIPVPCDTKSAHFAQIDRGAYSYNVRLVPEHDGRHAVISKRTLTRVNF